MDLIFDIIGAIAGLATFGAFLLLFKKDKDKQKQIERLSSIATILNSQNDSLIKQNDLIAQQVDIIRDSTLIKREDNENLIKLQELEEKKLKLKVAPVLWLNGAGTNYKGELKIDLNNKGERAIIDDFIVKSGEIEIHSKSVPWDLEKGERRYIFARNKSEKHLNNVEYEIEVLYHDVLNNNFRLLISGKGAIIKVISNDENNK